MNNSNKTFEVLNGQRFKCYDNGGKTADRYTVVYIDQPEYQSGTFAAVGMSEDPYAPQGFGQHCIAMPGRHLGKRVAFKNLPEKCQSLVIHDLCEQAFVAAGSMLLGSS